MAGKIVHFEFPAKDVARAKKFYSSLFGWKFSDSGMPGMQYFLTEGGGEPGGALYQDGDQRGPFVYFGVDDIDAAIKKVRALGGKAQEKQPIAGTGWWSGAADTEGNELRLFQPDMNVKP